MAQFIFFYRASPEAMQRMGSATSEQQQAHMGKCRPWTESNAESFAECRHTFTGGKVLTGTGSADVDGTMMGYAMCRQRIWQQPKRY